MKRNEWVLLKNGTRLRCVNADNAAMIAKGGIYRCDHVQFGGDGKVWVYLRGFEGRYGSYRFEYARNLLLMAKTRVSLIQTIKAMS